MWRILYGMMATITSLHEPHNRLYSIALALGWRLGIGYHHRSQGRIDAYIVVRIKEIRLQIRALGGE
jgi:hypothetical protein